MTSLDQVAEIAGSVCDPELPPLTLADLGILRSVEERDGSVVVTVTPTYSGCPAVEVIEDDIRAALDAAGCERVRVERVLSPAWTSDWITPDGHAKLTASGISPPRPLVVATGDGVAVSVNPSTERRRSTAPIPCPLCGSTDTVEVSPFGSTACKSLRRCESCLEPFDHVKEI